MATPVFDLPWIFAKRFEISQITDIDGAYTAHEQRNLLQSSPRYYWTVAITKNPTNFWALKAFVEARKVNFQAFSFIWGVDKEGDGLTYLVRFDFDKHRIVFQSDDKHWLVPLVQVVTAE